MNKEESQTIEQQIQAQKVVNNSLLGKLHDMNNQGTQDKENISHQLTQVENVHDRSTWATLLVKEQMRHIEERKVLEETIKQQKENIRRLQEMLQNKEVVEKKKDEEIRKLKEQLAQCRKNVKHLKEKVEGTKKAALEQTTNVVTVLSKKVVETSKKTEKRKAL